MSRLVLIFLFVNSFCVVVFAALYYTAGSECFSLSSEFSFTQMLWLSIHVFTTVGFGSDSPGACAWPQLLVFLEHFVGLIDIAAFTAIILSKLMQPCPAVRFSRKYLISQEDGKWLTFRMVRQSPYQLRDCELSVQCGLVSRGEGNVVTGCSEEALPLQSHFKSNLETWFVRHRIDESSPLNQERLEDLAYMNVTLKVFDTAFVQEVRMYHNYTPCKDVVHNARFETMKFWEVSESPSSDFVTDFAAAERKPLIRGLQHTVDHAKLDEYNLLPV